MKYRDFENGKLRELTPEEVCAMYHFYDEYAELGLGAIAYYKGLSHADKNFIKRMVKDVVSQAAQPALARRRKARVGSGKSKSVGALRG